MSDMKRAFIILVMFAVLLGLATPIIVAQAPGNTLLQNLAARPEFSNIVSLAKAAGIDRALSGNTQYTLFAPTNDALAKLPAGSLNTLTNANNKQLLSSLINYHVIPGKLTYSDLLGRKQITTVDGRTIPVTVTNGVVSVGGTQVPNQGIESNNGMIYPIHSLILPPGFTIPQAQAQAPQQPTGFSWGWLPWLIGGLLLAGLAYYLLSRRRRAREIPTGRYGRERYEGRVAERERPRRAEDTMRQVRETVSTAREPSVADIARNLDLPLSGDSLKGLNMLLDKGTFKDKPDFLNFLANNYLQNNLGSAMSGGKEPGVNTVLDIIDKTGIARGFLEGDVKKYLVPLMISGFMAVYHYLSRRPAVRAQ